MHADSRHCRVETSATTGREMPPALVAKLERWLLELSPQRPIMHAEHAGSMLRGAFGHALKAIACHCPLERHRPACVYQQIFEPQPPADWPSRYRDCPPAFVLTPPPAHAGAHPDLHFAITLLGPAVVHCELVWAAWLQAAQSGLGGARIPAGIRRAQLLTQPPLRRSAHRCACASPAHCCSSASCPVTAAAGRWARTKSPLPTCSSPCTAGWS